MQKYDFTAPASGASQTVNAPGRYVKYMAASAAGNDTGLIITPGSKPGSKILLYPGQAFTLPDSVAQPNGWTFANALGQANISGTLIIGEGRLDDNTLYGTVSVVDGGKSRTLAGSAFAGYTSSSGGASTFPRIQLWNPAGSNTRLVLEAVTMVGGTAQEAAYFTFQNAALATLNGTGVSKRASIATPAVGQLRVDTNASSGAAGSADFVAFIQAGTSYPFKFNEPFVIDPGYGMVAWGTIANLALGAGFEWYEEPNV